jgi:thioredoxin 1
MNNSVVITHDNFESEVIRSPIPVLIDFWASWCQPCKIIAPFLDELAGEYSGRVKIGKVNVEEEGELAEKHRIVSIPTLILYKGGEAAGQRIGAVPKHEIESLFKDFL